MRAITAGNPDISEHAVVHVPAVATENQTINPKMKGEFSLKSAN
jgi:hypothetical protein